MLKDDPIRLSARPGRFSTAPLTREDAQRHFQMSIAMMGMLVAILGVGIVANLAQSIAVLH